MMISPRNFMSRLTSSEFRAKNIMRSLASKSCQPVQVQLENFTNCHDYLHQVLTQNVGVTLPWSSLTSNVIETLPMREDNKSLPVKSHTVDTFVLAVCSEVHDSKAILDYIEFIKAEGRSISIAAYEYILSCWGHNIDYLSENDLKIIVQHCDSILENPRPLPLLKSYAITALANAGDHKKAFNLIKNQDTRGTQGAVAVRNIALKALKYDDMDLFWEVVRLDHLRMDGLSILNSEGEKIMEMQDSILVAYIQKCKNDSTMLEKIFHYMGEVGYFMRPPVSEALFEQGQKFKKVKLSTSGSCPKCQESIEQKLVGLDECKTLYTTLIDKVVYKDGNVFGGSSPQEFRAFTRTLNQKRSGTVDMVVDGLNLSLVARKGVKFKTRAQQSEDLIYGLEALKTRGRKIFLIHRLELEKFKDFKRIQDCCEDMFLASAVSNDDPFAILAALYFGPGTMIVSNDLFRQHSCLLEDLELRRLFVTWQLQHQVRHIAIQLKQKKFHNFYFPPQFPFVATKSESHWHLPIHPDPESLDNNNATGQKTLLMPHHWLCVK